MIALLKHTFGSSRAGESANVSTIERRVLDEVAILNSASRLPASDGMDQTLDQSDRTKLVCVCVCVCVRACVRARARL